MFFLYSFLLTIGFILMLPFFWLRREKYAAGFRQRLGEELPEFAPDARKVVWLHCVSVGETNAARPLVDELKRRYPQHRLIVSTTTRTGQELAGKIFAGAAEQVFYFPFDFKFAVRRALAHFQPDTVLLMETEIWFRFLREAHKSGVRLAIVNGRLSDRSFRNFSRIAGFMRRVLRYVDVALMQAEADAKRLVALGIDWKKVKITGNIKFDLALTEDEAEKREAFRARFRIDRAAPLILAASTHAPEEKLLLEAFRAVAEQTNARLLLVPRHPERFDEVAALIEKNGFACARRSQAPAAADQTARVILLDSIGELRALYPLAELVFVGGSLIPHGGQSILEPAAAARPIVTGPHTSNFAAAVKEFRQHEALVQLPAADENETALALARVFGELLRDEPQRLALAENAFAVINANRGATAKTMDLLRPLLDAGGDAR